MKKLLIGAAVFAVLAVAVAVSQSRPAADAPAAPADPGGLRADAAAKNPWTGLKPNADADQFQFAVVSDRTGGHRANVFSKAVHQINLLQPQFVMSVGDLIEGYSLKEETVTNEWDQFDAFVQKFEMPFFYVPGNHDLTNKMQVQKWGERYGKRYYHFTYKNCLFLSLNSENPPDGMSTIDPEQRDYVKATLAANAGVRWTFVFVHKPIWTAKDLTKNGWGPVEEALGGRKYTVFCGHVHRYQKFVRNGNNYYQLATTGGGSRMRGVEYGEFDQVAWVTMKKAAPVIANIVLDGILPEDLKLPDTEEPGTKRKLLPTFPLLGTLTLDGKPLAGAIVSLHRFNKETEKFAYVCDGLTDAGGRFQVSTYGRFDGAPAGEYAVTVTKSGKGYDRGDGEVKTLLPETYATPGESPLKVTVKAGSNEAAFEMTSK